MPKGICDTSGKFKIFRCLFQVSNCCWSTTQIGLTWNILEHLIIWMWWSNGHKQILKQDKKFTPHRLFWKTFYGYLYLPNLFSNSHSLMSDRISSSILTKKALERLTSWQIILILLQHGDTNFSPCWPELHNSVPIGPTIKCSEALGCIQPLKGLSIPKQFLYFLNYLFIKKVIVF